MLLGCLADMHPDTWRRADSFPRVDVGQRHSDAPHSAVYAASEAVFLRQGDAVEVEKLSWMPSVSRVMVDSMAAQVGRPHADVLGQRICGSAAEFEADPVLRGHKEMEVYSGVDEAEGEVEHDTPP